MCVYTHTCVHALSLSVTHSSSPCRSPLVPATPGICIKRLVNHYFFLVCDITALDGFQISSPTSCTSLQLIAQKADQPASHRRRGLGGQHAKPVGFGKAGSLLPSEKQPLHCSQASQGCAELVFASHSEFTQRLFCPYRKK